MPSTDLVIAVLALLILATMVPMAVVAVLSSSYGMWTQLIYTDITSLKMHVHTPICPSPDDVWVAAELMMPGIDEALQLPRDVFDRGTPVFNGSYCVVRLTSSTTSLTP